MAVTPALGTEDDPAAVAPELARAADCNRTAVLRALARLQANSPSGLGPSGQRARGRKRSLPSLDAMANYKVRLSKGDGT